MIDSGRRVAITGIGVVTPIGIGKEAFWTAAVAGESGIGPLTLIDNPELPIRVVGEVKGFEPLSYMSRKLMVRTARNTQFAFAACAEALADAGLEPEREDRSRIGLIMSCHYGGLTYYLENVERLHRMGPSFVSAYMAISWMPGAAVGQLSIFYGLSGYSKTLVNEGSGGLDAVGSGYGAIRRGDCDVAITGGFEATITDTAILGLAKFADVCRDAPDPESAFRPFSAERKGLVVAEGGAIVILEELEHARARGARIYAEVMGFAQTTDAVDVHHLASDGVQYGRAFSQALARGGLTPDDVSFVIADGRGTVEGDRAEARALQRAFGRQRLSVVAAVAPALRGSGGQPRAGSPLLVSAPKSMYGHAIAGAGAIDAACATLGLHHGVIPPTINVDPQDPECELQLVRDRARTAALDVGVIGARGSAGVNSAMVIKKPG